MSTFAVASASRCPSKGILRKTELSKIPIPDWKVSVKGKFLHEINGRKVTLYPEDRSNWDGVGACRHWFSKESQPTEELDIMDHTLIMKYYETFITLTHESTNLHMFYILAILYL